MNVKTNFPLKYILNISYHIPYVPVIGSLKILSVGGVNVKIKKRRAIIISPAKAYFGDLQLTLSDAKRRVSYIYDTVAQIKKIVIFSQSGDLPIVPLYV